MRFPHQWVDGRLAEGNLFFFVLGLSEKLMGFRVQGVGFGFRLSKLGLLWTGP